MALSYKTRRRLSLLVLLVALPAYIIAAVSIMAWLTGDGDTRPSILVELGIYIGLGVLWAIPLRKVFKGVGQADPDQPPSDGG